MVGWFPSTQKPLLSTTKQQTKITAAKQNYHYRRHNKTGVVALTYDSSTLESVLRAVGVMVAQGDPSVKALETHL